MDSRSGAVAFSVQGIQFTLLIVCLPLIAEGDISAALKYFMLMLYLEKIAVWTLRKTASIAGTNLPAERQDYLRLAKTIENHPSIITKQTNLLEQACRKTCKELTPEFQVLKAHIFPELKKMHHAIYNHFTCTESSFGISAIATGRFAPHQHFTSLSNEDGNNLIRVLTTNTPYNLNITFGEEVSLDFQTTIRIILRNNNLKQAAWGCVAFQQGFRDQSSIVMHLPQETLNHIYAYVYPVSDAIETKSRNNFIKKVTSYGPGLFKPNLAITIRENYKSDELLPGPSLSISPT